MRALDKFLSGSASWMRYVSAAAAIQTAEMQFHCDWDKLISALGNKTPAGQELTALDKPDHGIQRDGPGRGGKRDESLGGGVPGKPG
jgi:hypothetical protein